MKVLVACEFSGTVRDAFTKRGHYAMSCDLLPTDAPGLHREGDALEMLDWGWDLMIGHPPCTYLANSGSKHLYIDQKFENGPDQERFRLMREAAQFFNALREANIPRVCLENPIQHKHARALIPKYQQIVQPWMFGHGETKATCLWLKNLPKLTPTEVVDGREQRVHKLPPTEDRWKLRSLTYHGIADAMADQWGSL